MTEDELESSLRTHQSQMLKSTLEGFLGMPGSIVELEVVPASSGIVTSIKLTMRQPLSESAALKMMSLTQP
jgi:hypothetical protein